MSPTEQLERLTDLHKNGALTDAEFAKAKARVISATGEQGPAAPGSATDDAARKKPPMLWPLLGIGAMVLVILFLNAANDPEAKQRITEQDAIEACWKEQGRKSFAPGTQRFVAAACEMMEAKYEQRWGRKP